MYTLLRSAVRELEKLDEHVAQQQGKPPYQLFHRIIRDKHALSQPTDCLSARPAGSRLVQTIHDSGSIARAQVWLKNNWKFCR